MITDISIKNYRGIASANITGLRPLSVLTGANNSAKTTVLEAMTLFAAMRRQPIGDHAMLAALIGHRGVRGDARMSLFLRGGDDASIAVRTDDGKLNSIRFDFTGGGIVTVVGGVSGLQISQSPAMKTFFRNPNVCFVAAPTPSDPMALEEMISLAERAGYRAEVLAAARLIDPSISDLRILVDASNPILFAESTPDDGGRSIVWPIAVGGTGFKRYLSLAAQLVGAQGLVCVDDPDAFLHPGMLKHVAALLWSLVDAGAQVVIATHSPDLIDCLAKDINGDPHASQFGVYGLERSRAGSVVCALRLKGAQAQSPRRRDDIRQLLGLA